MLKFDIGKVNARDIRVKVPLYGDYGKFVGYIQFTDIKEWSTKSQLLKLSQFGKVVILNREEWLQLDAAIDHGQIAIKK